VSAASSQIEATIGERYPLKNADGSYKLKNGKTIADYGLTQAIFMGCVCGCLLIAGRNIMPFFISVLKLT
jgi:SHS family lactate transporter-like MFS transporter